MKNKLKKLPRKYQKFLAAASSLAGSSRVRIYLVGGVVRDLAQGLCRRFDFDLDIVVEGDAPAFAQKLAAHFKSKFVKHHAFGTATVYLGEHKVDFATARREYYPSFGALPRIKPDSLRQDLLRRDFTINAMAVSLNKSDYGALIDFYGGGVDLRKGEIRILHNKSFLEDPTRILRALRFQQRFLFKIEPLTKRLMNEAIAEGALSWVNLHRIRDELILILSEPHPYRQIKRLREVAGFSFLDNKIRLNKKDFQLLLRIERAISRYKKSFKNHRKLDSWLIWLAALLIKLTSSEIRALIHRLGLRKGEMIRITSIKDNLAKIKKLNRNAAPAVIYRTLAPLSFEAILFFYAYYAKGKLHDNIEHFLKVLVGIRLKLKGRDLRKLNIEPTNIYNKLFRRLLHTKLNKGFKTKKQEVDELNKIYKKYLLIRRV